MLLTPSTMQSSHHQQGVPQRMLITLLPLDQQLRVSLFFLLIALPEMPEVFLRR